MHGKRCEHVVEKAHAGIDDNLAAVKPQGQLNVRFFCFAHNCCRPYLVFDAAFPQERVGDFDTCMTEEFFRALSDNAGFTLHLRCPYGKNSHHMIEALFKACAHALCDATAENSTGAVLSTKGTLSE